jgi:hypothetical protein
MAAKKTPVESTEPPRCLMCKREMIPSSQATDKNDDRIDCGGDCWGCMRVIEAEMDAEESLR